MRVPLIPLNDELRAAIQTSTVLTETARQASELRYAWAYEVNSLGNDAWPTPSIRSIDAWIRGIYDDLARLGYQEARYGLLQRSALNLAFRQCAPDYEYHKHTRAIVEAWRLYCEWILSRVKGDLMLTENGRLFARWLEAFEQFQLDEEMVTTPQLASIITDLVRNGSWKPLSNLTLFACNELTPSRRDLLRWLEQKGTKITKFDPPLLENRAHSKTLLETLPRERSTFAQWSRERLASLGEESRIGIVLPSIESEYLTLRRHFEATFFDCEDIDRIVNLGAGVPLQETRLCQDAMKFLYWTTHDLSHSEVLQLGRSPYLKNLEIPQLFSDRYPELFRLSGFAFRSDSSSAKQIASMIAGQPKLLSQWIETVHRVLQIAGWDFEEESEEEQRALASFVDVLNDASKLSSFIGRTTWQEAVALVLDGARSHQLAYESRYAPIQAMSRQESLALQFDALWVAAVGIGDWPPKINPNPMIPLRVQRRAIMPRTSDQSMLRWSESMSKMWAGSAPEVVFSATQEDEDIENVLSLLLEDHSEVESSELIEGTALVQFAHPWGSVRQYDVIRKYISDKGTKLPRSEYSCARTGMIRDQSNCPFRAWAIHRLGLKKESEAHQFPDALQRGTAIHSVLNLLATNARNQSQLMVLSDEQIEVAIEEAIEPYKGQRLPDRFLDVERSRLRKVVRQWLQFELTRQVFEIKELEKSYQLQVEGMKFGLRVDRIDETPDLSALVIDYKTGNINLGNWSLPRPMDTQMPLYSMAVPDCDGLAYENISSNETKFRGLSKSESVEDGLKVASERFELKSGTPLPDIWRTSISSIVKEFQIGLAKVDPTNAQVTCRNCHLSSLCREFAEHEFSEVVLENDSS